MLFETVFNHASLETFHLWRSDLPDNHRIVSVCWQEYNGVCNAAPTDLEVVPLMGPNPPMISERLLGLKYSLYFPTRVFAIMTFLL